MKRISNLKWFTLGLVCALAFSLLIVPGLAATNSKQATLNYRDIKITLDGTAVTPTDANGSVVEPFIIDGTTYLPVRGVSGALGLGVEWDEATSTVKLTSPSGGQLTSSGSEHTIYITRTGSKYHYDSTCNGGTYWEVPLATAIGMGLEPCDKCVH